MTISMARLALALSLVLLLVAANTETVLQSEWMNQHRLVGLPIIGMVSSAIAILGIFAQLGTDLDNCAPPSQVTRRSLIYATRIPDFMLAFLGGICLLLMAGMWLLPPSPPQTVPGVAFALVFLCLIAGLIRLPARLSERGILGSRF